MTEVAATPSTGEFRPDYSTKADGNEAWNTGLIEFSSVDAGKIVQVTYTGTGTLAGVNSNHWPSWYTDCGDGSDGDFVPTEDTTISGVKNYKSVFIKAGITVTIDKYVLIKCQGAFVNNGTITATGKGGNGGIGAHIRYVDDGPNQVTPATNGETFNNIGGAGGGIRYNGAGGGIRYNGVSITVDSMKKVSLNNLFGFFIGSGGGGGDSSSQDYRGGNGGVGGGSISIVCSDFNNTATIQANGTNGANGSNSSASGGGGGAGGGVVIICNNKISEGTLSVTGGSGGTGEYTGAKGSDGFKYIKELGA